MSATRSAPNSDMPSTARARTSGVTSSARTKPSVVAEARTAAFTSGVGRILTAGAIATPMFRASARHRRRSPRSTRTRGHVSGFRREAGQVHSADRSLARPERHDGDQSHERRRRARRGAWSGAGRRRARRSGRGGRGRSGRSGGSCGTGGEWRRASGHLLDGPASGDGSQGCDEQSHTKRARRSAPGAVPRIP